MSSSFPLSIEHKHRAYVWAIGMTRYWHKNRDLVSGLPVFQSIAYFKSDTVEITLPNWAQDIAPDGYKGLLVDRSMLRDGVSPEEASFKDVDWWGAAFHHINATAERLWERENKTPLHSYSLRLKKIDKRLYDYAWTNRIFLFLRRWAAKIAGKDEKLLFGAFPSARIDLTHDVDYFEKTWPLRLKKTAFDMFNVFRFLGKLQFGNALKTFCRAVGFFFLPRIYWCLPEIMRMEEKYGYKSTLHFYGRPRSARRGFKLWLFDPSYDVQKDQFEGNALSVAIRDLKEGGWRIGLHQSFDSWFDAGKMKEEKSFVEGAAGALIERCRQHWLKFSWEETWKAQQNAGFKLDATLGFNDRPGFRNSTALLYHPWDETSGPMSILSLPTVFMDSHFWDYDSHSDTERLSVLKRWVDEVIAVGGEASVIWHQRVYHEDYGWGDLYEALLRYMNEKNVN